MRLESQNLKTRLKNQFIDYSIYILFCLILMWLINLFS